MERRDLKFRVMYEGAWRYFDLNEHGVPDYLAHKACLDKNAHFYQFTGLYDKNGREIYEGDIVRNYAFEYIHGAADSPRFTVIFKDGAFQLDGLKRLPRGLSDKRGRDPYRLERPEYWEVVGTITG